MQTQVMNRLSNVQSVVLLIFRRYLILMVKEPVSGRFVFVEYSDSVEQVKLKQITTGSASLVEISSRCDVMDKYTSLWIRLMDWCSKYWGCHQLPERSFFFRGYQFPVCARCTGIMIGYLFSIVYCMICPRLSIWIILLLIIPMAVDGLLQYYSNYTSNNKKRLITGFLSGFGFIQLAKTIILSILKLVCS